MSGYEMQRSFERIIQQVSPSFALENKPSSDTIFQYLYQYTLMFVRNTYLQADQLPDGSRANSKNMDAIKGLSVRTMLTPTDTETLDKNTIRVELPSDYFLYIRSNSLLSHTYKVSEDSKEEVVTPNKIINEDNIKQVQTTFYNHPIIRNPFVVLNSGTEQDTDSYLNIIHDDYSSISKVELMYYRKPKQFGTKHIEGNEILDRCELPDNVHMEIVEGAVNLFLATKQATQNNKQSNQNNQQ